MKVLLLPGCASSPPRSSGDPFALGDTHERARPELRRGRAARRQTSTASWWPRSSTCARTRRPTASSSSTSTPATASRSRSAAAPSTWRSATWCRSRRSARRCPAAWRSPGASCAASGPTACCARARELELGDDHGGILVLPPDLPGRRVVRRRDGHRVRRPLRPRPHAEPARRASRCIGVARDVAAKLGVPFDAARTSTCPPSGAAASRAGRGSRSSTPSCAAGSPPACCRACDRAVAAADRPSPDAARHAPDQLDRRHLELRDARVRPADPHLRPRQGRAARRCGCGGRRDGETLETLDGQVRTFESHRRRDRRR